MQSNDFSSYLSNLIETRSSRYGRRQEIALARAELTGTIRTAARLAAGFGVAALFALGMFGAVTALLIVASSALPLWLSTLIVTALYAVIAGIATAFGRGATSR